MWKGGERYYKGSWYCFQNWFCQCIPSVCRWTVNCVFGLLSDQTENQLSHFLCTRSQRKLYIEYERLYNAQYSERSVLQTKHIYLVQQVLTGDYIPHLRGIHQKLHWWVPQERKRKGLWRNKSFWVQSCICLVLKVGKAQVHTLKERLNERLNDFLFSAIYPVQGLRQGSSGRLVSSCEIKRRSLNAHSQVGFRHCPNKLIMILSTSFF